MNIEKLEKYLLEQKMPSYRSGQIQKAVFQDGVSSFSEISTLPKDLREKMEKEIKILSFEVVEILEAKDGQSIKALLKIPNRHSERSIAKSKNLDPSVSVGMTDYDLIETVLISPKPARLASTSDRLHESRRGDWSACISCQVGCQMGCRFCATGSMGFKRDLTAEEITDQILFWKQYLKRVELESKKLGNWKLEFGNYDVNNIVYMGMGEPFNNWPEVSESIRILTDKNLFAFGSRSLSVSTSGIANGILKLAEEFPQVNLAISLHFADDEKRSKFMPVNQKYNLEKLKESLQKYFLVTKRKIFIEYILLENINDSRRDAENLVKYLKSVGNTHLLHVNLIRYNTTSAGLSPSSKVRTQAFKEMLAKNHINATIRKSLGEEIKGACGQLAAR